MGGVTTLTLPFRRQLRVPIGQRLGIQSILAASGWTSHWRLSSSVKWKNFTLVHKRISEYEFQVQQDA